MGELVSKISGPQFPQIKMKEISSSKTDDRFIPQDYKKVAQGMEQQFAEYMLSQMNNTIDKSENETQDSANSYYENMQTAERAKAMVENKGTGLGVQKIILDQIYPQRLRTETNYNTYQKMKEQNALHKKTIQTHKVSESNSIAIEKKEAPRIASDIAKGELQ